MKRCWIVVVVVVVMQALHGGAGAEPPASPVDLPRAVAELRLAVNALPPSLRSERLRSATAWMEKRVATTNAADVSLEYTRSLERAAELLRQQPDPDVVEDVTAELEAKVEHCRTLGIGMGGQVSFTVNTLRDGKTVTNWRVLALLKFYERLTGTEPRTFERLSSPTEMDLEPGRYWIWAVDPGTGRMSERELVRIVGQKALVFDLPIP
jgi:hypothetical protein